MADGNSKKARKRGPSTSWRSGTARKTGNKGGGETKLTEFQKVLLVNGGMAHRLRTPARESYTTPKTRKTRSDKRAA